MRRGVLIVTARSCFRSEADHGPKSAEVTSVEGIYASLDPHTLICGCCRCPTSAPTGCCCGRPAVARRDRGEIHPVTKLRYGADYSPEQWPEKVWDDDSRMFDAARIGTLPVGVFTWALTPRAEGPLRLLRARPDSRAGRRRGPGDLPGHRHRCAPGLARQRPPEVIWYVATAARPGRDRPGGAPGAGPARAARTVRRRARSGGRRAGRPGRLAPDIPAAPRRRTGRGERACRRGEPAHRRTRGAGDPIRLSPHDVAILAQ